MNYTILQAIYLNDKNTYLDRSLQSIFEQSVKPSAIVLVRDGPITLELEKIVEFWSGKLPINFVGYDKNQGLAHALNYGLQFVETELVARMDSDDYCFPNRFEKQLKFFEQHSDAEICGTGITEFYVDNNRQELRKERFYPEKTDKSSKTLFKGTPLGHPTVMMKTSLLKQYKYSETTKMNEDIELWFRLIKDGHVINNIQEPLLNFRITDGTFKRRSLKKAFNEFNIYRNNLHYLFGFDYRIIYVYMRLLSRFLPYGLSKKLYFSKARSKVFNNK